MYIRRRTIDTDVKMKEHARVIEWDPYWSTGAPMPHVLCDGFRVFLVYDTIEMDFVTDTVAMVEFAGSTFRFGIPNDEVLNGHPLWNNGLKFYSAHVVENSSWIAELKAINKVHPYYDEKRWEQRQHFLLTFKDQMLEVIAEGYKIETFRMPFHEVLKEALNRMNS